LSTHGHIFPAIKYAHSACNGQGNDRSLRPANEYVWPAEPVRSALRRRDQYAALLPFDRRLVSPKRPTANQVRVIAGVVEDYRPDVIVTNPLALSAFNRRRTICHRRTTVSDYCEYLYRRS
jgi:hypothetical protein